MQFGLLNCIISTNARLPNINWNFYNKFTFKIQFDFLRQIIMAWLTKVLMKFDFCWEPQEVNWNVYGIKKKTSASRKGKIALFSFSNVNHNTGCILFNSTWKKNIDHSLLSNTQKCQPHVESNIENFNMSKQIQLIKSNKNSANTSSKLPIETPSICQ